MWVIDIRHWLDNSLTGPRAPQLRSKVLFVTHLIMYATAVSRGLRVGFLPACWRRPNRKPCKGKPKVSLDQRKKQIHWICPKCKDEGIVTGWTGLIWDMSAVHTTLPS